MSSKKIPTRRVFRILFHNYRTRLTLAFILCTILPLIIIGAVSYDTSYRLAEKRIFDSVLVSANQLVQQFNNRMFQLESVADSANQYAYDLAVRSFGANIDNLDTFGSARSNIKMLSQNFHLYQTCIFLPDDSFFSNEGLMFYGIRHLPMYRLNASELTGIGIHSKWICRKEVDFPHFLNPATGKKTFDVLFCCQSLTKNNRLIYALFSSIKTDELTKMLTDSFSDTAITAYICSPDKLVIASNTTVSGLEADMFEQFLLQEPNTFVRLGNHQYLTSKLDNGFLLVAQIPTVYIENNIFDIVRAIIITFLILIPTIIGATLFTSHGLSKKLISLDRLVRSIQIDKNRIHTKDTPSFPDVPSDYMDEIDHLSHSFQRMLGTIDQNLSEIIELTKNQERLKYKLLQSQINPHFLYNILGSIQTCMTLKKYDVAMAMAGDLAKFYRITLRKNTDLIRIKEELEIAALYLKLEKLLKQDAFTYSISCEDGLENFMICKFTLQPFLENCIHHGICQGFETIHISISLRYGEDTVIASVHDNGVGIDERTLHHLQDALENHRLDYTQNFGICNVNERISSPLFGSGSIQVQSSRESGTEFVITFQQIIPD